MMHSMLMRWEGMCALPLGEPEKEMLHA